MALRYTIINISQISDDQFLRGDCKCHLFVSEFQWNIFNISDRTKCIPLGNIIEESYDRCVLQDDIDYKGIPTGKEYIDQDGFIISYQPISSDDCPDRLKYSINKSNILISSLRLAKSPSLNFQGLENLDKYVFSNGYYIFSVKNNWNLKFVLHLLRNNKLKTVIDNSIYRGIGISAYKSKDLLKFLIPKVDLDIQDKAVIKISKVEGSIQSLKSQIKSEQRIINEVFCREFKFDISDVEKIDKNKYIYVASQDIDSKNINLRNSSRWHKLQLLEDVIFRNIKHSEYLRNYLINEGTKNGWSPECSEFEDGAMVLGIDAINKDGVLTFDNPKYTNQTKKNINDFIIKENNFFISRGNTVDLVALASIAMNVEDNEYIYPDLMIRITFDTTKLDKEYLAYVFNSVIGRMYFKYAAKGKQQTMVKVSSEEIKQFLIPTPDIDEQIRIVSEIKLEIDKQNEVQAKLEKLRAEIDDIIDSAIAETK